MTPAGTRRHFPGPTAALLLTLGAWLGGSLVASSLGPSFGLAALGLGQVVGLGGAALLGTVATPPPHAERIGLRGFSPRVLPFLLLLLPLTVLGSEVDNWARALVPPEAAAEAGERAQRMLEEFTRPGVLPLVERWVVVVGLAPVLEEWLYRGVIQQGLVAHLGRVGGVLAAAALFGLGHATAGGSLAAALLSFASAWMLGAVLGAVRLATGSLLACMLVHGGLNAAGLAAVALGPVLPVPGFNAPGAHTPAVVLVPCALAVGLGLARLVRDASRAPDPPPLPPDEGAE